MGVTSEKRKNGNDPRKRNVMAMAAAGVHADCEQSTADTAAVLNRTDRTVRRWKREGVGSPQDQYNLYVFHHPRPYRLVSHIKTLAKMQAVGQLSDPELIARFHALRQQQKTLEAEDTCLDLRRNVPWLDRGHMKERNAAIPEELAAICYEFAVRGITDCLLYTSPSPRDRS